jgi:flagellar motor switch protein FliN/FliY
MLSQEELDQLLGGEQSGGGDESLDQNDLDAMFGASSQDESGGEDEAVEEEDGSMSQDDLDAMLGGGGGGDAGGEGGEGDDEVDWGAAFAEAAAGGDNAAAEAITTGQADMAEEDEEEEYEEDEPEETQPFIPEDLDIPHIHFILDLPLELTVEIGRTIMNVKTLLQQNQGSVIELTKHADEPVEIYVGSKLMATGEVVVVDDNFGVRIEDVASQADRIRSLGTHE